MHSSGDQEGSHVGVACPACSPDREEVHEVLSGGGQATVQCRACGHVHKTRIEDPTTVTVRTVVSLGEESERTSADVPTNEELAVGEEFVAELEDGPVGVRITSLETVDGDRVDRATVDGLATIWARAVDNVGVQATIHPSDGSREGTRSETYYLPGDERLTVGDGIPHLDEDLTIEGLVVRDDAIGYDRRKIDARGESAPAKDVARLYARRETDEWTSAWG